MARPKKTAVEDKKDDIIANNDAKIEEPRKVEPKNDYGLPKKELFRIDEVATFASVTDRCIRLWIEHGHLEAVKIVGGVRVKRDSIIRCIQKFVPNNV